MILTRLSADYQSDENARRTTHFQMCLRLVSIEAAFVDEQQEEKCRLHAADIYNVPKDSWGMGHFDVLLTIDQYFEFAIVAHVGTKILRRIKAAENVAQPFVDAALKVPGVTPNPEFNQRVEVHMPGQALSVYNRVMLLEDACTDALQTALDQGWRIIAACPQPDARRPDYILGRFEKDNDDRISHARAERRPDDFRGNVSVYETPDGKDRAPTIKVSDFL